MCKRKDYHWYLSLIYAVPLFVLGILIIYRYSISPWEVLFSDYPPHLRFAEYFQKLDIFDLTGKEFAHIFSYPLFHITVALIGFITGSVNIASAIVNSSCLILTAVMLRKISFEFIANRSVIQSYAIDFFCVTSVFISGICGFVTNDVCYLPLGTPNVWHNPTYTFMRPFAIAAFYYFIKCYNDCFCETLSEKTHIVKSRVLFALMLFLSVLAKPNFALFFLLTAGIVVAVSVLRNLKSNGLHSGIVIFLCVLPSILLMLWQKWFCEQFTTVSFGLDLLPLDEIISKQTLRGFVSLYLSSALFFVFYGRKLIFKDTVYTLIIMMLAAVSFIWYCTVQGIVIWTDYCWSYYFALFLSTVTAAVYSLRYIRNWYYWAGFSAIWLLQLAYGVSYMIKILLYGRYLI